MRTDNVTYRNESARDEMEDAHYALLLAQVQGKCTDTCYCRDCDNARLITESRIAWRY